VSYQFTVLYITAVEKRCSDSAVFICMQDKQYINRENFLPCFLNLFINLERHLSWLYGGCFIYFWHEIANIYYQKCFYDWDENCWPRIFVL